MKSGKILSAVLLAVLVVGCEADEGREREKAVETATLYIEMLTHYYLDGPWKKENEEKIYHDDMDGLAIPKKYEPIPEFIERAYGSFLFSKAEIGNVINVRARVNFYTPKDTTENAWFIKVTFHVIAMAENRKVVILETPREVSEYLVLGIDKADNRYKILDFYPSMRDRYFIGVPYILKNPEKFDQLELNAAAIDSLKKAMQE